MSSTGPTPLAQPGAWQGMTGCGDGHLAQQAGGPISSAPIIRPPGVVGGCTLVWKEKAPVLEMKDPRAEGIEGRALAVSISQRAR